MFFNLPTEIQAEIYLFDSTYHEVFQKCLRELTSKILKIGDIVMLEENLVDVFYLPKHKCFQPYIVSNMIRSQCGYFNWIELNSTQYYRIYELKKVLHFKDIVYYYSFLTKTFQYFHSRLFYDFQRGDLVEFDKEGFRGSETSVAKYAKFSVFFGKTFQVEQREGESEVFLKGVGKIPNKYLKLSKFSPSYPEEYDEFLKKRNLVPKLPF
jgi:hypothetical protein